MSSGERAAKPFIIGGASGTDGVYSFGRGGSSVWSDPETQSFGDGVGDGAFEREGAVREKTWFTPVEEDGCKDGVCPVPWVKAVDMLMDSEFLTQDRNSNFPGKNPVFTAPQDLVNHPPHYTDGKIECIEAIEAQLTPEEFRGYAKGNIAKYLWREKHKGGTESLKKARWYLNLLIKFDEDQKG